MEDWDMDIGTRRHEFYNGMVFITRLVSPLPECWEYEPEVYKTIRKISLNPITKYEIADFFSRRPSRSSWKFKGTANGEKILKKVFFTRPPI